MPKPRRCSIRPPSCSTDAHSVNALNYMRFGVDQARRGWLTADHVLNIKPLAQLKKRLRR
jgi:DNA polymerase (family 10)